MPAGEASRNLGPEAPMILLLSWAAPERSGLSFGSGVPGAQSEPPPAPRARVGLTTLALALARARARYMI